VSGFKNEATFTCRVCDNQDLDRTTEKSALKLLSKNDMKRSEKIKQFEVKVRQKSTDKIPPDDVA